MSPAELKSVLSLNESELEYFLLELGDPRLIESILCQIEGWRTPEEIVEEAKKSPAIFRKHLMIQAGPSVASYDRSLDPWQRKDLETMDPGWAYMARVSKTVPPFRRCYLERGRGHSKTTDIAALVIWAIMSSRSMIWGYAAAAAESQAELLMKAISQICHLNPWVSDRILVYKKHIKNPLTGSTCEIVPAEDKTTFGETPNFVVGDELTHWHSEAVWSTLFSGIAKVSDSLMAVISNAGFGKGRSWQWELREKLRQDPAWYFHSLDGVQASWLTPEDLAEQMRILGPKEFRRLFKNKWLTDTTDGIPAHQIEKCTVLPGPAPGTGHGWDYVIGALDLGLTSDRAGLIFLGISLSRYKIGLMSHFRFDPKDYPDGQVQISDVEDAVWREKARYGEIDAIYADNWQAVRSLQEFQKSGIRCFEVNFSRKQAGVMGKRFVDAFRNGILELYYDQDLEDDILEIEVKFSDVARTYHLDAERTEKGHADSAIALAIGVTGAMDWLEDLVGQQSSETAEEDRLQMD